MRQRSAAYFANVANGSILLGQVATLADQLAVACSRCDRAGWVATARLLAEHGPHMPMTDLRRVAGRWVSSAIRGQGDGALRSVLFRLGAAHGRGAVSFRLSPGLAIKKPNRFQWAVPTP